MSEKLRYLAAGIISMLVSWVAMWSVDMLLFCGSQDPGPAATALLGLANWASGVAAAYILNRAWVFRSGGSVRAELARFLTSRVATLAMDQVLRQVLRMAGIGLWPSTVLVLAAVTVANYLFGKRHVFRDPDKEPQKATKL